MSNIPKGFVKIPVATLGLAMRKHIKDSLTIVGDNTSSFSKEPLVHNLCYEDDNFIGVPRGFYLEFLKPRGVEAELNYSAGGKFYQHEKTMDYRPGQEIIVSTAVGRLKKQGCGGVVVEAGVGSGKTFMCLSIARELGHKVLIIVHTTVLMEQWKKEIKFFFPKWKIGEIQGPTVDVKGKDVVVAMVHSLAMKDDYPEWIYDEFGTIVSDEVHLMASKEFSKGCPKFSAKYFIGASGTVTRKDKCEKVFFYIMGPKLAFLDSVKTMEPEIYFVDTGFAWTHGGRGFAALDRQRVRYLTDIVQDPARNAVVVRQAEKAAKSGRNVLILSERVEHIKELARTIQANLANTGLTVGVMVGTSKQEERDISQKANIICATVQLVGTGFNEPRLDTLIFATPVQNVTQAVGRVTRLHPDKKKPLVLDFVDTKSQTGMIFAQARFKRYREKGWKLNGYQCFSREFLLKHMPEIRQGIFHQIKRKEDKNGNS